MTMSSDQYETGNSSVKISDGAKGSTVEVKVYAKPVAVDENVKVILHDIERGLLTGQYPPIPADAVTEIVNYIDRLRSQVPDMDAAQKQVNAIHLKTAAMIEKNGGMIAYDPDKRLLAAWEEMEDYERAKNS